ncbi:PREDICTED: putative pentatricopeptide repeat-containing protein At3g25060, mitochondrial [Camelina sativa]|uniref:Pentatricopeptide repeat-containing protein At3g25060, mitochondrial n=1 Tax=Camelina sativa TaxID=90675 RepID=A0ABM0XS15_CAMSA|nr:PREDICTED: putative pentatricopeptide repeat-containing protein At3g25060, mitochondrial [Camelina sativa]
MFRIGLKDSVWFSSTDNIFCMLQRTLLCPRRLKLLLSASNYKRHIAQVYAFVITSGNLLNGSSISRDLVASCGRIGEIFYARKLFDELPQRSVSVYNSMVVAYSRGNQPDEVLRLYDQMIAEKVQPDSSTFTMTIKACLSCMALEKGEAVWCKAVEFGYKNDVFVCSSVLNLYMKFGKMDEAEVLFGKMTKRDVICWTTMVTGFAQGGKSLKAVEFYREMQNDGFGRDKVVMLGLLQASGDLGDMKMGRSVHGYLIRTGLPMNVVVETSLVDMYAKVGFIELASKVFSRMMFKTTVSWGSLISGFAQNGLANKAFEAVVEMQSFGFQPDLVTLVGVLVACSQVGSLKTGRLVHCFILKRHVLDRVTATALMDMYSKCGAVSKSREIFEQVGRKDLVCWNTMISCYGIHGNGQEVVSMFLKMRQSNIEPDHATFASLLSALSHSGLVEQGQRWFSVMINKYNIQPSEKHYVCLIDLLARAGRVEEALEMIKSAKLDNALPIWVALLSGCISHRNLSVGDIAANKILQLNPDNTGIQTLVSNFFATANKWKEVAKVRKLMRNGAMEKVPGYSAIEVNGQLRTFLMEDLSHHEHYHILQVLRNLNSEMKNVYTYTHF